MLEALQRIDRDELSGNLDEPQAQRLREELLGHEAVDMQAYLVKNLRDLASIGDALGKLDASARYRAAAERIAHAVNEKLWDEEAGFYFDRWGSPERVVRVFTAAPLVALYAGDLVPRDRAERLLSHLLRRESFWTRWPVPTVARDADGFDADEYWRGSTWVNVNWFIVRGLISASQRFGEERWLEPARAIAERTVELVLRFGFREYYRSGGVTPQGDEEVEPAGFGPEGFGWSALSLDLARMLDEELAGVRGSTA
jgi:glycogen debranching enzyme